MQERRYVWVAPYGGVVGQLTAVLVLVGVVVLYLTKQMDGTTAVLFGALALARLL